MSPCSAPEVNLGSIAGRHTQNPCFASLLEKLERKKKQDKCDLHDDNK